MKKYLRVVVLALFISLISACSGSNSNNGGSAGNVNESINPAEMMAVTTIVVVIQM